MINNKCKLVLLHFMIVLLVGCPTMESGAKVSSNSSQTWDSVLKLLNQDTGFSASSIQHANLQRNLAALNQSEMERIDLNWQRAVKTKNKSEWDQKNIFFHQKVSKLNRADRIKFKKGWVAPSLDSSRSSAQNILSRVQTHPVTSVENILKYPQGSTTGYCFGRALLVHYQLLKNGFSQKDLFKVFTYGELLVEGQLWTFHVSVGYRDASGQLWMVDPLQNKVMGLDEWITLNRSFGIKGPFSRVRFYYSDPRKFLPAFGSYHLDQIYDPDLKPFFADLISKIDH